MSSESGNFHIRHAKQDDTALILGFIRELAEYEKLIHEVVATESDIETQLFGARPMAECIIAEYNKQPVGFALFFH
ncbi:MAG: GNAT family N-acetyltransferase, partial [Gammaproteobacteria bacterium]